MKCIECQGACCESILLPLYPTTKGQGSFTVNEINRWLSFHGNLEKSHGKDCIEIEAECSKLTVSGKCSIYETRPLPCVLYEPGGDDCLITVKKRRTPDEYQRIRDDEDPKVL